MDYYENENTTHNVTHHRRNLSSPLKDQPTTTNNKSSFHNASHVLNSSSLSNNNNNNKSTRKDDSSSSKSINGGSTTSSFNNNNIINTSSTSSIADLPSRSRISIRVQPGELQLGGPAPPVLPPRRAASNTHDNLSSTTTTTSAPKTDAFGAKKLTEEEEETWRQFRNTRSKSVRALLGLNESGTHSNNNNNSFEELSGGDKSTLSVSSNGSNNGNATTKRSSLRLNGSATSTTLLTSTARVPLNINAAPLPPPIPTSVPPPQTPTTHITTTTTKTTTVPLPPILPPPPQLPKSSDVIDIPNEKKQDPVDILHHKKAPLPPVAPVVAGTADGTTTNTINKRKSLVQRISSKFIRGNQNSSTTTQTQQQLAVGAIPPLPSTISSNPTTTTTTTTTSKRGFGFGRFFKSSNKQQQDEQQQQQFQLQPLPPTELKHPTPIKTPSTTNINNKSQPNTPLPPLLSTTLATTTSTPLATPTTTTTPSRVASILARFTSGKVSTGGKHTPGTSTSTSATNTNSKPSTLPQGDFSTIEEAIAEIGPTKLDIKNVVILSLGSCTIKLGLATNDVPSDLIPTVTGKIQKYAVNVGLFKTVERDNGTSGGGGSGNSSSAKGADLLVGEEAWRNRGNVNLKRATYREFGVDRIDWEAMSQLVQHAMSGVLRIKPEDASVMIVMKPGADNMVCMETFNTVIDTGIFAASWAEEHRETLKKFTGKENPTGILMDFGYSGTRLIFMLDGEVLEGTISSPLGGACLIEVMKRLLQRIGYTLDTGAGGEFAREVMENTAITSLRSETYLSDLQKSKESSKFEKSVMRSDGSEIVVSGERLTVMETLFQPNMDPEFSCRDAIPIHEVFLDGFRKRVLNNMDHDQMLEMLGNVVFVGGICQCPGFTDRMQYEIQKGLGNKLKSYLTTHCPVKDEPYYTWNAVKNFVVDNPIVRERFVTKEQYDEYGELVVRTRISQFQGGSCFNSSMIDNNNNSKMVNG
jgi:actin-related protein